MNLLDQLQKINPNILEFIHQDILDESGSYLGSRCNGLDKNQYAFSGGTARTKEDALRIAIAEAFERSFFFNIASDPRLNQEFDLINFPSSSGFAAGFDEKSTRFRAICEGIERWAWSKWIDDHYLIEKDKYNHHFSPLASFLLKSFDEVFWFRKNFNLEISPDEKLDFTIVIFLGCSGNGIFPGSRVSTSLDDLYEHPVIEAHRSYINYTLHQKNPKNSENIIEKRTIFFGQNKELAISQIQDAQQSVWPKPELYLLKKFKTQIPDVFLYRCLLKKFIGWHDGSVERFVY